jgi:hypothetical protein
LFPGVKKWASSDQGFSVIQRPKYDKSHNVAVLHIEIVDLPTNNGDGKKQNYLFFCFEPKHMTLQ